MVSPMREKRVWPPQDKDADGETAAAFEAAVAVVKETVVRSGEVLVSAKEDLSNHQRWLKVQTAAVEADRERHARWLQRQRERQEAIERREKRRARRRARRQAAARSLKDGVAAAVFAVRSTVWRLFATIAAGLNAIDATAFNGVRWIGARFRGAALYVGGALWRAAFLAGIQLRAVARVVYSSLASGLGSLRVLLAGSAARAGAKVNTVAPVVGNVLGRFFGAVAASTRNASDGLGQWLRASSPWLSDKADNLGRSVGARIAPAFSFVSARAQAFAPVLSERIAKAGAVAGTHLRGSALRAKSLVEWSKAPAVDAENAVSLPHRLGRFDLSQMLIIAGTLLLVFGALMLGGGLLLRTGKPSMVAAASPSEPIAWLFEHDNLALDERSVFTFAAMQEGTRIKGFAIGGVNMSDQTLDAVGSVIKPDHKAKDVKLALSVEMPDEQAGVTKTFEPGVPGAIPPEAQFKLLFAFPEDGGMTPGEVLSTFGGVMLKVRYEVAGKDKSFIHYLSPAFLERQLAEIMAEAKGS